jgi:hypothetical protein
MYFIGFSLAIMIHTTYALAAIDCSTVKHPYPGYVCRSVDTSLPTLVTFRKMPAWAGNASFLIIDACEYPEDTDLSPSSSEGYLRDNHKLELENDPIKCIRRYCSDDNQYVRLDVRGIPIPIYFVTTYLSFGFQHTNFEVRCESLENTESHEDITVPVDETQKGESS